MDEIYNILKSDEADADHQIRAQYLDISHGGRFAVDLYMNLANTKKKVNEKLEILAILQRHQQETATALERFTPSQDKGKGMAQMPPTSGGCGSIQAAVEDEPQTPRVAPQDRWMPTESFLEEPQLLLHPYRCDHNISLGNLFRQATLM